MKTQRSTVMEQPSVFLFFRSSILVDYVFHYPRNSSNNRQTEFPVFRRILDVATMNPRKFHLPMNYFPTLAFALAVFLLASNPASAQHENPNASLAADATIVYKTVELPNGTTSDLSLHLFKPTGHKASDTAPCIVFFFGGGWSGGSPAQFYPQCKYLADRGMVAISAEYRTESSHQVDPKFCVFDGKSAMRWVRGHAEQLGVDPNRIAAGGGSAGGHVAAAIAACEQLEEPGADTTISCRPDALVLFNPVYDNGPTGYGHDRVKKYWQTFSPMHNLHADMPATISFFGSKDNLIPVATTEAFQKRMLELGVRCDNHIYEGAGHGFFNYLPNKNNYFTETIQETERFLLSLGMLNGDWSSPDFWITGNGQPVGDGWEFVDGEIRLIKPNRGGDLLSPELPSDFELSFEWKIDPKTNSGLKYRVQKFGNRWLGPEYQIIDEPAERSTNKTTAAIYAFEASSKDKKVNPPGEWNRARIIAVGNQLEHELNGEQVAAILIAGPDWVQKMAGSKFRGHRGFANPSGPSRIMLTDHGGRASFRNFEFVVRPAHEAPTRIESGEEDDAKANEE